MVSASDSNKKSVKDSTMKLSAVEAIAEFAEIHLQVLGAGAVVGAIDKGLCVSNHVMQPFEEFTIRVEYCPFMVVAFRQRFPICVEPIGLYR